MKDTPFLKSIRWKIALMVFFLCVLDGLIICLLVKLGADIVISVVIGVTVSTVLCIFVSKFPASPLGDLAEKTELMVKGDFSKRIEIHSNDEIGRLAAALGVLRQKLDENFSEIKIERDKLETILKQMADGLLAVDSSGRFIHANDAARRMLRMTEEDTRRKRYDDIILRFCDGLTLEDLTTSLLHGVNQGKYTYGGAYYEVRFEKFSDDVGGVGGIIIVLRDVTEREKIDNMQVDFVANVSHELKTPLTSIKGYTETLLEGGAPDRKTELEFLNIINNETDRMNRLVKDLLQLSRLDTNRQKWDMRKSDVVALVRQAVKMMEMTAKSKNQQLNMIFDRSKVVPAVMDRDKIEQVIMNIISNAIKYTKPGGRIDVDLIFVSDAVKIVVSDNGIGIPEKEISRVFERFFQVDRSRSGQRGGTGLGLAISKQIIEEHHGSIGIESEYGKGTKVIITLPLPQLRSARNIL
ncbi:MAG: cell wall metabolism sensor histidine kinase WalK [Clostridiales Family XIII bacterium]|jgi:two-component system sensor histidine kinase VicK|nr:cell wall metabolism sensor histidine kinase WalK [Clostridiales Family XIII bacterium]